MKKVLFIDRDGTLVREPADYQVDAIEKIEYYPGVFQALGRIARELDYELVMVTNQDGLGTDSFPEHTFWPAHHAILRAFANEGIEFKEVLIDRTFKHENAPTRKPGIGLLLHYFSPDYDLANSVVIGDRITDVALAHNLGAKAIWLNNAPELGAGETTLSSADLEQVMLLQTTRWEDIFFVLQGQQRSAKVSRRTHETQIEVQLALDGTGQYAHRTGIGFFDHMLDQLAKHSGCDLRVEVVGDLHIDEHHTIEDTALALGEAFRLALGDKRGIERYGAALLPMDDCLAQVALDFSGRPWLVWSADFTREHVGGMPTEMFFHFFKSFSDAARCNLNIKAEGSNAHHKIEVIFKALARAIRQAIARTGRQDLPTTKGML